MNRSYEAGKELYIGLMSGTSMDGVDAALCEVDATRCKLVASLEYPFPQALKEKIFEMIKGPILLADVGETGYRLGMLFSEAVNALLAQENIDAQEIRAIGSHGQTLWHAPKGIAPFSMQLGDANVIAAQTHIDVVSDFRGKDIALGGEGAPFAPVFHRFLFDCLAKNIGVLNIGGMANLSVLGERLIGFDTGPGNALMDLWIGKQRGCAFDREGAWAEEGSINRLLLEAMLSDTYFAKAAPKSTGRELFNERWLSAHLHRHAEVPAVDVQATLLELTVQSAANAARKYDLEHLLVCGGGVKNSFLMHRLAEELDGTAVNTTDAYGVDSDQMEAMLVAWLAYKRLHLEPVELSSVTGAKHNGILGGVYAKD
jgi:anhydro-N-acetylmuramic acid kinase